MQPWSCGLLASTLMLCVLPACPSLQPNVGRYTTGVWTRAYLEQQLRLMLAGRAAEELVFGRDELSSLHQAKLMLAREVSDSLLNCGSSSANIPQCGKSDITVSFEEARTAVATC